MNYAEKKHLGENIGTNQQLENSSESDGNEEEDLCNVTDWNGKGKTHYTEGEALEVGMTWK